MNQVIGASIAAAGIKFRPLNVAPMTQSLTSLVQVRSFLNPKAIYIPTGKKKEDLLPIERSYDLKQAWFGPAFVGEVERRYLDYLGKLEWESLKNHIKHFPRKHRSKNEKWLIFDKWAAQYGRKYPSLELKKWRFVRFEEAVDSVDGANSLAKRIERDLGKRCDISGCPVSCFEPPLYRYWVESIQKSYASFTPEGLCELRRAYKKRFVKEMWQGYDNKVYVLGSDNKVYEERKIYKRR